jgi:hypothetical protein
MRITRTKILISFLAVVFVAGGVLINRRVQRSIPLRYAQIPEQTKKFFRDLESLGGDVKIKFTEDPIMDRWKDETNEGENAGNGFFKIEDANFIVYYHNEGEGNRKANLVHGAAMRAVQPLAALFGKYFYPADVNGRKLALYVCGNRSEYNSLSGTNNSYSIAVTVVLMSPSGALCRGIFFAPETFSTVNWQPGEPASSLRVQKTIWHEMAHYVYFSSLDLSRPLNPPQWVTEGIAEYASGNADRLRDVNVSHLIPLHDFESQRFRSMWVADAYWIGYTAFVYFEKRYSVDRVRYFLQLDYRSPTGPSIEQSTGVSFERFDQEWQESVRSL